MSLEYVVQRYGGLNVELPVPGGPTVPLSLSHLANMNHSTTFVKMRVELVPEGENELDDYSAKMDSIERRRKA